MTHAQLVELGCGWLKSKCAVIVTEVATSGEEPDVLGWRGRESYLIECKATRADFKSDKAKPYRKVPQMGVGRYRFILCPKGMLAVDELSSGWGLLEAQSGCVRKKFDSLVHDYNPHQEIQILLSCVRRIGSTAPKGISIRAYTHKTLNRATISIDHENQNEDRTEAHRPEQANVHQASADHSQDSRQVVAGSEDGQTD